MGKWGGTKMKPPDFTDYFNSFESEVRQPYLINKGILNMMYADKKVYTLEMYLPENKLSVETYDALFSIRDYNKNYHWRHKKSEEQMTYVSPIDGEKMLVYLHVIYVYKEFHHEK